MAVGSRRTVAGEMLERGEQARRMMGGDECGIVARHHRRIGAVGAAEPADDRVFRIEIDVGHRTEIDGEAEIGNRGRHPGVDGLGLGRGIAGRDGGGTGDLAEADIPGQPLHHPALLIERDERRQIGRGRAKGRIHPSDGIQALDIGLEQHDPAQPARVQIAAQPCHGRIVDAVALKPDNDHLARHLLKSGSSRQTGSKNCQYKYIEQALDERDHEEIQCTMGRSD